MTFDGVISADCGSTDNDTEDRGCDVCGEGEESDDFFDEIMLSGYSETRYAGNENGGKPESTAARTEKNAVQLHELQDIEQADDCVIIVPEEINITGYSGGTVYAREEDDGLSYPCVYITAKAVPAYKAAALQAILSRGEFDGDAVVYTCYLDYRGNVMQLGYMDNKVMRELMHSTVFTDLDIAVFLDKQRKVSGKYLNALCAV